MIFGSVCSGIEAATVAWEPLDFAPAFYSEIDRFPRAVLHHHYPDVPLQRLIFAFCELAKKLEAKWIVWENVPGVLSSNGGRDFGAFIGLLAKLGYGFAYRVLDAKNFGIPQSRKRVFLVASSGGDWQSPAKVLFEREGASWNVAQSRKAQEKTAGCRHACAASSAPVINKDGSFRCLTARAQRLDMETENFVVHCTQDPCFSHDTFFALGRNNGGENALFSKENNSYRIRRLTPVEYERLQGFPDDYTKIPYKNKPADRCPDSPRYKAIGNSMCVPVMRWIGEGILLQQKRIKK